MSGSNRNRLERFELGHKQAMVVGLAYGVLMTGLMLGVVFGLLRESVADWGARILPIGLVLGLLAVRVVTLRGRRGCAPWGRGAHYDEWTLASMNRAAWAGFGVTLAAQMPLMFMLVDARPGLSVVGMAGLTISLGVATFSGSYLYFSRLPKADLT